MNAIDEKGWNSPRKPCGREWTGEPIDHNYAQEVLAQYDTGDR